MRLHVALPGTPRATANYLDEHAGATPDIIHNDDPDCIGAVFEPEVC